MQMKCDVYVNCGVMLLVFVKILSLPVKGVLDWSKMVWRASGSQGACEIRTVQSADADEQLDVLLIYVTSDCRMADVSGLERN